MAVKVFDTEARWEALVVVSESLWAAGLTKPRILVYYFAVFRYQYAAVEARVTQ